MRSRKQQGKSCVIQHCGHNFERRDWPVQAIFSGEAQSPKRRTSLAPTQFSRRRAKSRTFYEKLRVSIYSLLLATICRGTNIRRAERQSHETRYTPASTYTPENPAETASVPAIPSSMVAANAFIIEGDDDENAHFTSRSTRLVMMPRTRPTAITPNKPKLKNPSPNMPGLKPGCT